MPLPSLSLCTALPLRPPLMMMISLPVPIASAQPRIHLHSKVLLKVAEQLAGTESERAQGLLSGLGLGDDTPKALAKKLSHIQMAVVSPQLKIQDVVRIADAYPMDFLELSVHIYDLTGQGKVAQVKRKPSGKTQTSRQA